MAGLAALKAAARAAQLRNIPPAPQAAALETARANAVRMLGLPENNTPMERAAAMNFPVDDRRYHGTLYDVGRQVDLDRTSPQGYAGRGFYATPSGKDASMNYASPTGPDIQHKILTGMEQRERPVSMRLLRAVENDMLTPRRMEKVLNATGTGEHLGAVYPVMIRRTMRDANIADPRKSGFIGPAYRTTDDIADDFTEPFDDAMLESPDAKHWQTLRHTFDEHGVDPGEIPQRITDAELDGLRMDELWSSIKGARHLDPTDAETGEYVGTGGLASEVIRRMGAGSITHPTRFNSERLNIGGLHQIALQPEVVRSRFAAFDPARIGENDMMGYVDPRLLGGMGVAAGTTLGGIYAKARIDQLREEARKAREQAELQGQ